MNNEQMTQSKVILFERLYSSYSCLLTCVNIFQVPILSGVFLFLYSKLSIYLWHSRVGDYFFSDQLIVGSHTA